MREFFKGWRRKAGVVTLLMACCLMGMWVRSRRIGESVEFILAGEHHFLLSSTGSPHTLETPHMGHLRDNGRALG